MNKVMDGFVSVGDSYKPVLLSSDRQSYGWLSFVGDQMVLRTNDKARIVVDHSSDDSLIFRLVSSEAEQEPASTELTEPAQETEA
jgi:hypothetical protein